MQAHSSSQQHKLPVVIPAAILVGSLLAIATTPGYATTLKTTTHQATAYGVQVKVGSTVTLGPVAVAELPSCSTQEVGSFTASAASADLSGLLSTGAIASSSTSTATSSTGTSDVLGINLLGGLITATEIKA